MSILPFNRPLWCQPSQSLLVRTSDLKLHQFSVDHTVFWNHSSATYWKTKRSLGWFSALYKLSKAGLIIFQHKKGKKLPAYTVSCFLLLIFALESYFSYPFPNISWPMVETFFGKFLSINYVIILGGWEGLANNNMGRGGGQKSWKHG